MHIDTSSYDTMLHGTCEYLGVTPDALALFFDLTTKKCMNDKCCNGHILNTQISAFVLKNKPTCPLDKALLFHLSRRLNETIITTGTNLFELLTTESPLFNFFNNHQITFKPQDGHLIIFESGNYVSIENTYETGVCYLRSRLGYNNRRKDYCFNGFAFKDLLYKNHYARSLYHGPEFVTQLSAFLKRPDIAEDYFSNSTYYCLEYCVPLDMILFDDKKMKQDKKSHYFITRILNRLFDYANTDPRYLSDNNNLILRLSDGTNIPSQYYCKREYITCQMLS